nr:Mu transposase C-terminal domain-containing protein [Yimella sp. cx-51]
MVSASGAVVPVAFHELGNVQEFVTGRAHSVHEALLPRWDGLSETTQRVALDRLEVVLEVLTGHRYGFPALAVAGEPRAIFDPRRSLTARCRSMSQQLQIEQRADRARGRRVAAMELLDRTPSSGTVLGWVRAYETSGVWGLVDKRATRDSAGFEALSRDFIRLARAEFARFDGDISEVSLEEVHRRIQVEAKVAGIDLGQQPDRAARQFLSSLKKEIGRGTRAHRTRSMRDTAGYEHFTATRPGQVVAIDATRADVLVWDDLHERSFSVEVLTAIDVATRVVLALRVVPKSANAVDASLLLYDVMRPFEVVVDGTTVSDWRWAGMPESVWFDCDHARADAVEPEVASLSAAGPLQGTHRVPSLLPDAIRCDHGSIFVSGHFRALLTDLGIDLLLSRGTRPTDNAHIERWHETLQAAVQQIAGYKGRNPYQRGRVVGRTGTDRGAELISAADLERQLRMWVALEYHRNWHEGLTMAGAPQARLTPLELFDAYLSLTGRIDVPQRADLIYQFLPIKYGTIQHDGVEFNNLTYDDPVLDAFRDLRIGAFRAKDRAAPFFHDPRDVTRVWFRHPETGVVHTISWRGAWRNQAPLTANLLHEMREKVRARGGNTALGKRTAQEQILRELTELARVSPPKADQALWSAARLQHDASRRDHFEAQLVAYQHERQRPRATDNDSGHDVPTLPPGEASTPRVGRTEATEVASIAEAWARLRVEAESGAADERGETAQGR